MRYLVERQVDEFEDVGADSYRFEAGGVLEFRGPKGLLIAYAPGQWITVVPGDD